MIQGIVIDPLILIAKIQEYHGQTTRLNPLDLIQNLPFSS